MSIHFLSSPQVAGLSTRFRFGPPEDMLPQTSASHSDLGQLASQGGNTHTPTHTQMYNPDWLEVSPLPALLLLHMYRFGNVWVSSVPCCSRWRWRRKECPYHTFTSGCTRLDAHSHTAIYVVSAHMFPTPLIFVYCALSVTVFTESLPSDSGDNLASQSVPMVTASTGMASADDGDEVFMDPEGEGWAA